LIGKVSLNVVILAAELSHSIRPRCDLIGFADLSQPDLLNAEEYGNRTIELSFHTNTSYLATISQLKCEFGTLFEFLQQNENSLSGNFSPPR
jgi:hypothetical protein